MNHLTYPVKDLAPLVGDAGSVFVVDTVTSIGGLPVTVDDWQADTVYSGTQKCLSCPPGLAPLTVSEAAHSRRKSCHDQLVTGLDTMGLSIAVEAPYRLPMLNAISVPDGVDEATVRSRLLKDHDIEIGAGLGPLAGKICRVGVMGESARPEHIDRFLGALKEVL